MFPEVHEEFLKGKHTVNLSTQPHSRVWTDMALEQSINLDFKMRGGIIGTTQKSDTLERWFLTRHERAAIASTTKQMYAMQDEEQV